VHACSQGIGMVDLIQIQEHADD